MIHGAAHGAWCWRDVIPALERLGHSARAIDLPSHGADATPVGAVTLEMYAEAITSALEAPAIVVGHSMGGFPISLAAERAPERFARLVYLSAYVPWPGLALSEMRKLSSHQPLLPAIVRAADGMSFTFDAALVPGIFYPDCPGETVHFAMQRLCPQAVAPSETRVDLGDAYASVPRSYVICERDGAIPPDLQARMAVEFDSREVFRLPSSHSPFFSMPVRLAGLLSDIAARDT